MAIQRMVTLDEETDKIRASVPISFSDFVRKQLVLYAEGKVMRDPMEFNCPNCPAKLSENVVIKLGMCPSCQKPVKFGLIL